MEGVTYSQNPKRLGWILVILGGGFIALSVYLAFFENFSWPALFVGMQAFVLYKNSQRLKYFIKIDNLALSFSFHGEKREIIELCDIKSLNIKLFEIHIEKEVGETSILNLGAIKDRELKKIKASFQALKGEL
ncbi:MAG: hypothetical protein ACJA2S_001912 [Cyclobacteriaceae bacterium]|jgi:hypothetical protein